MKRLYGIFLGLSVLLVSFIQASEVSNAVLTPMQVAVLHAAYDEHGNDFVNYLPTSVEECRQELIAEQRAVQASMDSFSYKNVFISQYGLLKTGMLMASLVGMWAVGNKFNMNTLAYEVANDFANALFSDASGDTRGLLVSGKPRIRPGAEFAAADIAAEKGYKVSFGDINNRWPDNIWREIIPNLPEAQRNSQVIENAPVDRIQQLQKYQLASQALAVGAAISGFGLYKDIQAMRAKKAELAAELEKIDNMLAVLEKVQ